MKKTLLCLALASVNAFASTTLFYNGKIHTEAGLTAPDATWMTVQNGKITDFGQNSPPITKESINLGGKTVFPGLTDSHAHIMDIGKGQSEVSLRGSRSEEDAAEKVAQWIKSYPPGKPVIGNDWDQSDWPGKQFPKHETLDKVSSSQTIILYRVDGHAAWVNGYALKKAGIGPETPDPAGGKIYRDAKGEPTGVLIDQAIGLVNSQLPDPTLEERKQYLEKAVNHALSVGITSAHDAGVSDTTLEAIEALLKEKKIRFRFYEMLKSSNAEKHKPVIGKYDGQLDVRAVKLYIDGAMGSRGALFETPYEDDPTTKGLQFYTKDELNKTVQNLHGLGFQVAVHAIGSLGNKLVIDAIETLKNPKERRHRLEHAQVFELKDIARAAQLGMVASMQPTHCTSDMKWVVDRIGKDRARYAYAWRSVLNHKMPLAFGSDAPVESINPWPGLYSAVTRQILNGTPESAFFPEERLTLQEAFRAFTEGAAFSSFHESDRGRLKRGYVADFILLKKNPYSISLPDLHEMKVEATYVGGVKVFETHEYPRG